MPHLVGNYELLEVLGRGGMGVVYKARHITTGVYRAVKKIYEQFCFEPHFSRVLSEAKIQSELVHPNIVQMFDPLELDGHIYLVMEYVKGTSLSDIIRMQTGPIIIERAIPIMNGILEALHYIHSVGIIHRDIKPSNIILSNENTVKLTDFGIAKDLQQTSLTTTGTIIGTIEYMSPEQLQGQRVDAQSDIYSVGMTLYEMLAGRLPYNLKDCESFISKINVLSTVEIPRPSKFYPDIPNKYQNIVMDCLQKDKDKRFKSVDQIIDALKVENYKQRQKVSNACPIENKKVDNTEIEEEKFVAILSSNLNKSETIQFLVRMGYPVESLTSLYPTISKKVLKNLREKKRTKLILGIIILVVLIGMLISFSSDEPALIGSLLFPLIVSLYLIFSSIIPTKIKEN